MDNSTRALTTVGPQDGQRVSVVGDTYRILLSGEQTGGAYALIDMLIPQGGGPGPHSHAAYQEAFFVIDGEIEVTTEAGKTVATAGALVNIPSGGMPHKFTNAADKPAHILCLLTPAGMEPMFLEIGQPVAFGAFLPRPDMNPDMQKKMGEIAEKYGQKLYPPDYFDK